MEKDYNYYISNIKPLEKKYNIFCILYSIFKWQYFYNRKNFYNKILIKYYKIVKNNSDILNNIIKKI